MINPTSVRLMFEEAILGACLLDNSFYKVADVLSYKNFTANPPLAPSHQTIWQVMATLYPNSPIDVLSVLAKLPRDYTWHVLSLSNKVCQSVNIRYHALSLLEIDFREKYVEMLQPWNMEIEKNLTLSSAIRDVTDEVLDYTNDVFETLEKASEYLRKFDDEELNKTVLTFMQQIDSRIVRLKQQAQIDTLFFSIERMRQTEMPAKPAAVFSKLIDEIKLLILTGKVADEKANQILAL